MIQLFYKLDDIQKQYYKLSEANSFKDVTAIANFCHIDIEYMIKQLAHMQTPEAILNAIKHDLKIELSIIEEKTRACIKLALSL